MSAEQKTTSSDPLKLSAADPEDIVVLSALLQDAVVPVREMVFIPEDKRFVFVANRFRWERASQRRVPGRIYERVRCGVSLDRVTAVRRQRLDQKQRSQILVLLALEAADGYLELVFAGGTKVRLEVDTIVCHAEDFGEPWPTMWRPDHSTGAGASRDE